jgi:hypothetical protein
MKKHLQRNVVVAGLPAWFSVGCSARTPDDQHDQVAHTRVVQCRAVNGTWEMIPTGVTPSATDTVFALEIPSPEGDLATMEWIVSHPSVTFWNQQYFMGPSGLRPRVVGFQARISRSAAPQATFTAFGTHDGVMGYVPRPFTSSPPPMLFFRTDNECGIQQYLHEEQVR